MGLPNPNGSLSSIVSSRAIVEANRLVEKEMNMTNADHTKGTYTLTINEHVFNTYYILVDTAQKLEQILVDMLVKPVLLEQPVIFREN